MAMAYRARLPAEFDLADLTHGERELARWAALPFGQKLQIVAYLLRRLARLARDEARRTLHIAAWEAGVYARCFRTDAAVAFDAIRQFRWTHARAPFDRGATLLAPARHWVAPAICLVILMFLPAVFAAWADEDRRSVRELAIEARALAPPPCSLTDGDVWVRDSGRYWRPRDTGYLELRQTLCGF